MVEERSKKRNLDEIGKLLIAAGSFSDEEVEEIAAKPFTFERVRAQIAPGLLSGRTRERVLFMSSIGRLAFAASITAVLCVGAFLYLLKQNEGPAVISKQKFSGENPGIARLDITPQVIVKGFTAGRATISPQSESRISPQNTLFIRNRKDEPSIQKASLNPGREPEFYPVTYGGDGGESVRGGRVVRVDISRSTLFAMGVALPLENESETVKADLLIGPDGVTRAFRLVE